MCPQSCGGQHVMESPALILTLILHLNLVGNRFAQSLIADLGTWLSRLASLEACLEAGTKLQCHQRYARFVPP